MPTNRTKPLVIYIAYGKGLFAKGGVKAKIAAPNRKGAREMEQ